MKIKALDYYQCPRCRNDNLMLSEINETAIEREILNAHLDCPGCGASYDIRGGVPWFAPERNYADSFGFQWNLHAKTQLDTYTDYPISRDRLFGATEWPTKMTGQIILEAGSGSGRFTEILLQTEATIFSFDYSSAVNANWANNGRYPNLNLFQGDIFNIPLRQVSFDKVLCLGVLQHTPDPEKAFKSLAKYLRPGGELVIDVFSRRLVSLLRWKYLLRPLTKRMNREFLYRIVCLAVSVLLPLAIILRGALGRFGARLMPIVEYSNLGLPYKLNKEWALLDTFDMYSPQHDHPQSIYTVERWFKEAGFVDIVIRYGQNGIIAKGRWPE